MAPLRTWRLRRRRRALSRLAARCGWPYLLVPFWTHSGTPHTYTRDGTR